MDYLQYKDNDIYNIVTRDNVLNLIINGLPSIHSEISEFKGTKRISFKPYYKWITFNTIARVNSP